MKHRRLLKAAHALGFLILLMCGLQSWTAAQEEGITQGEFAVLLVREIAGERELPVAATVSDYVQFLQDLELEPLGGWSPDEILTTGDLVSLLKLEEMTRATKRKLEVTVEGPGTAESEPALIEVPDNAYADKFEVDSETGPYLSAKILAVDGEETIVSWRPKNAQRQLRDVILETGEYPFSFETDTSQGTSTFILRWLEHTERPVTIDEVRALLAAQVELPFILPQFMPQISPGSPGLED